MDLSGGYVLLNKSYIPLREGWVHGVNTERREARGLFSIPENYDLSLREGMPVLNIGVLELPLILLTRAVAVMPETRRFKFLARCNPSEITARLEKPVSLTLTQEVFLEAPQIILEEAEELEWVFPARAGQ